MTTVQGGGPATQPERRLLDIFDADTELETAGATSIEIDALFAERIDRIIRIPHRYTSLFISLTQDGIFGEGSSPDARRALKASVCEALERHLATRFDHLALVHGPYDELRDEAVDPATMVLLSDWEYEHTSQQFVRYGPDLPLNWVPCWEIVDGDSLVPRLMPATLAVLRYGWARQSERFVPTLSPGIAAGDTYLDALLHGFYELVERDAFAIAWLNRLSCPKLDVTGFSSPELTDSLRRLVRDGFRADFVDLTMDVDIPVVLCVITEGSLRLSGAASMGVGLGANVDQGKAKERAYSEALEILANFYSFDGESIRPRAVALESPAIDLTAYFDEARFLVASAETREPRASAATGSAKSDELRDCLARLGDAGLTTYFCDLTPPELRERVRYRLVRAFASHLQPHLYEWDAWRLENPRLYSAPVRAGHRDRPGSRDELNLEPNPFTVIENLSRH